MTDTTSSTRVRLCAVADVGDGEAIRCDAEGLRVALVRIGEELLAVGDRCSHANYSLAEGIVDARNRTLECPKHGSCFSLDTGEPDSMPATKPVPVYAVEIDGDDVYVRREATS
jgi:3-phenylpropionate/trans-cinnamate dioxygenase ferredoxin component